MATVQVHNQEGKKVADMQLNDAVFNVAVNPTVLHQVITALRANSRPTVAATKDRSAVRGGGKKPWRQKGTGRARHGSIRSPLWRSGGVTFGPTPERNATQKINKKVRRKALLMSLSDKIANQQLIVVDSLELKEPKTKAVYGMLKNLKVREADKQEQDTGKTEPTILMVLEKALDPTARAARNIERLSIVHRKL